MNNTTFFSKIGSFCLVFIFSIVSSWAQCDAPTGVTLTSIDQVNARVDWIASIAPDVTGYESELRTSNAPGSGIDGLFLSNVSNATFINYDELVPGTNYYFYVRSKCVGGVSGPWTAALAVSTPSIVAPVAIAATDVSSVSFVARWEAVTGATEYQLEVATDYDWPSADVYLVGNVFNRLVFDLIPETTYQYRVSARNGGTGPWSEPSNFIIVTTTSVAPTVAVWTSTGWSAQPTINVDLQIKGDYNTGSSDFGVTLFGKSLTVFAPFKFTIAPGTFVEIADNITNLSTAANFVQESNSNLNQRAGTPNLGQITVKRNSFPIYRLDYTMWSSPVGGQNLKGFSPETVGTRFYSYNSSTNQFNAIVNPQDSTFVPGRGYLVRAPNNWPAFSTFPGVSYVGKFVGIPTPGNVPLTLQPGYNMIGNPFPCDISASSVLSGNTSINSTLYFWRRRNNDVAGDPTTSYYATWTSNGGVGIGIYPPGQVDPVPNTKPNGTIKVGQGFMVSTKVTVGTSAMNFTRTMKKNNNFLDVFLKTSEDNTAIEEDGVERHKFYLNLTGGPGIGGQLLLAYAGDASDDLDDSDGKYIGDSEIALTSIIGNESYVIQGKTLPFAANDEIALRFETSVAASYTIALEDVTGMFTENVDPLLVDMLTNTTTNLRNASYSFASEIGIFDNRFKVVYEETALGTVDLAADVNAVVVMSKNNVLTIDAGSYAISNVEIYDMLGRKIYSKSNVDANSAIISDLRAQNQIILVQIATNHGVVTKKVQF